MFKCWLTFCINMKIVVINQKGKNITLKYKAICNSKLQIISEPVEEIDIIFFWILFFYSLVSIVTYLFSSTFLILVHMKKTRNENLRNLRALCVYDIYGIFFGHKILIKMSCSFNDFTKYFCYKRKTGMSWFEEISLPWQLLLIHCVCDCSVRIIRDDKVTYR